jgi:anti-sigma factor RsiW
VNHAEAQELLGAYALDAVDPAEAAAVEDHLRECPRCRAEVASHRETAAFLAHAGTDAPPAVWDRIVGAIEGGGDEVVPFAPPAGRQRPGGTWSRVAPGLVAAAAALVIAVLGVQLRAQGDRIDDMEAALAASDRGLAVAMADPDARVVELAGAGTTALPVVISDGRAWLQAAALPPLAADRTYQLWGQVGDELVSVAVLGNDPGVVSFDVAGYALLAITEERAPGVVQSANDPVVAGQVA